MTQIQSITRLVCLAACAASANACVGNVGGSPDDPAPDQRSVSTSGGAGALAGLVTGRIYDDLAQHIDARIADFQRLGVRRLRVEIERPWHDGNAADAEAQRWAMYRTIIDAAARANIEVMGLIGLNAMRRDAGEPRANNPRLDPTVPPVVHDDGTISDPFVDNYLASVDDVLRELPGLAVIEVWNEPDVEGFHFVDLSGDPSKRIYDYDAATNSCITRPMGQRYTLLAVRVYEHVVLRRERGEATPLVAAFSLSHQDDRCLTQALFDNQTMINHRFGFRPGHGLPDGPPCDVLSPHGYGQIGVAPSSTRYTASGTFEDAVRRFLDLRFADGATISAHVPVWYGEVGYDRDGANGLGEQGQADALAYVAGVLRKYPRVETMFWYDYRDDEGDDGSGETMGLRANARHGYAPHKSYDAYQRLFGPRSTVGAALAH